MRTYIWLNIIDAVFSSVEPTIVQSRYNQRLYYNCCVVNERCLLWRNEMNRALGHLCAHIA